MRNFLGVDGGGTRTRALLITERGEVLAESTGGPGNLHLVGEDAFRTTIQSLLEDLGEPLIDAAVFGLAGISVAAPAMQSILSQVLPAHTQFQLRSDAEIALAGAHRGGPGLVLIVGTGSICLGRTLTGQAIRVGGWGPQLDDAGSAGWIGREALRVALRQADGRLPGTAIREMIFQSLQIEDSAELTEQMHKGLLAHRSIAHLAPGITELANHGDSQAKAIQTAAIDELVGMVCAASRQAGAHCLPLAMVGGLVEGASEFKTELETALKKALPKLCLCKAALTPAGGAALLAKDLKANETPQR